MAKFSLEHCKSNDIILVKTKEYLELYKNYTGKVMSSGMLYYRIKEDKIDYVLHNKRYYIMINKYNLSPNRVKWREETKKLIFTKYKTTHNNSKKRKPQKVAGYNKRVHKAIFGRRKY